MNAIVKHFAWTSENARGRIAVVIENDMIEIVQISGQAIPADMMSLWNDVLGNIEVNGENAAVYADRLNRQRKNRIGVQIRQGMSGCVDIKLRSERDARLHDYPVVASLHVSMYNKLNGRIKMWLGDFAALNDYLVIGFDNPTHLRSQLPHETVTFTEVSVMSDQDIEWLQPSPEYTHMGGSLLKEIYGEE